MTIESRFYIERENFILDIDLSISERGVTAFLGPSGCGKTTLLRAIAGLEVSKNGYLRVGERIWQDEHCFLATHKRPLGYVFQEPSLLTHLSVLDNLEYGLKRLKGSAHKISLSVAIELLGIGHLLERKPHQLSGGEQQRVAIARAIAVSPELLLMDEPLAALDIRRKQEVMPYLESLHQELKIPILYVSHSHTEVARLADQIVVLENGRIQATGSVCDVFSRVDLSNSYGFETESVVMAVVTAHDEEFNLTYLDFSGERFTVSRNSLPLGTPVQLQIRADDVSLSLAYPSANSILNIFPGIIDELTDINSSKSIVRLAVGNARLLARVSRKSAVNLALMPGKPIFVQIKHVALMS